GRVEDGDVALGAADEPVVAAETNEGEKGPRRLAFVVEGSDGRVGASGEVDGGDVAPGVTDEAVVAAIEIIPRHLAFGIEGVDEDGGSAGWGVKGGDAAPGVADEAVEVAVDALVVSRHLAGAVQGGGECIGCARRIETDEGAPGVPDKPVVVVAADAPRI